MNIASIIVFVLAVWVPLGEGLKCYNCAFISNIDNLPISIPIPYGKECQSGKPPDNFLTDCSKIDWSGGGGAASQLSYYQNTSTEIQSEKKKVEPSYVCGKATINLKDQPVSVYIKTCLLESAIGDVVPDGKCNPINLSTYWDIIRQNLPILPEQPPAADAEACFCNNKDGCNGASSISILYQLAIVTSALSLCLKYYI